MEEGNFVCKSASCRNGSLENSLKYFQFEVDMAYRIIPIYFWKFSLANLPHSYLGRSNHTALKSPSIGTYHMSEFHHSYF